MPAWIEELGSFALCSAGAVTIFLYPGNDFIAAKLYEKLQFLIFCQQRGCCRCRSVGDSELSQLRDRCTLSLFLLEKPLTAFLAM